MPLSSKIWTFAAIFVSSVLAAPMPGLQLANPDVTESIPNHYIVVYKRDVNSSAIEAHETSVHGTISKRATSMAGIKTTYQIEKFRGYHIEAEDDMIASIISAPEVDYVEADAKVHTNALASEDNAPYGLDRISHRQSGSSQYVFDDSAGRGVTIYVVDTGIMTSHNEFGGRARWGTNFVNDVNTDENGHGTHCSGTAAGASYGVAKAANLVAVKVLDANGDGTNSRVLSGMQWVVANSDPRRAVLSMSLGGSYSAAVNSAVESTVASGVTVVVAAGNNGQAANGYSPGSAPDAITVGAIDSNDAKTSWSNFGPLVDVFAPGLNILSSWIGSDSATNTISGTSMSTPHVAGLAAYLMSLEGISSPGNVVGRIQSLATSGGISGAGSGSPNLIAYNGDGY